MPAPASGDEWPADALVYVLGQDWRDADPDPAIAQQISQWRALLQARSQSYVMLYGRPSAQWQQLAASLKFMEPAADWDGFQAKSWSSSQKIRRKACEQCGDPECELALFEALKSAP
jgi:hypothetical protein